MKNFTYHTAQSSNAALAALAQSVSGKFLGGGTNLVDLMRERIEQPAALIDVTRLDGAIQESDTHSVRIGAAVNNTALAAHSLIRTRYPLLAQAVLSGASGQIRNMATVGGNILQRTRCSYFYDSAANCNKRKPQTGCDALEGYNRMHAILGASDSCIAVYPSDMWVALTALDAEILIESSTGKRTMGFNDFHTLPGDTPDVETNLKPDELITAIEIPKIDFAKNSLYRKVRDRASYAFALVSVGAALEIDNGVIKQIRLALGGVAPKPWRAWQAERLLLGAPANESSFLEAAEIELRPARGLNGNAFKIELTKRLIVGVLNELSANREYQS